MSSEQNDKAVNHPVHYGGEITDAMLRQWDELAHEGLERQSDAVMLLITALREARSEIARKDKALEEALLKVTAERDKLNKAIGEFIQEQRENGGHHHPDDMIAFFAEVHTPPKKKGK